MSLADLHRRTTYADLIWAALNAHETRIAFVDGGERFSYARARERVLCFAATLASGGVQRGSGVAVLSTNSANAWFTQAAAIMLGCRFVPLHPQSAIADLVAMCVDAAIDTLVFESPAYSSVAAEVTAVHPVRSLRLGQGEFGEDLLALAANTSPLELTRVAHADDIAWQPYTGGTTGRSKSAMLSHTTMVQTAWLALAEIDWPKYPQLLACTPISHGVGVFVVPALLRGGTVHLHNHFDPERFLAAVETLAINSTFIVPTILYSLLDQPGFNPDRLRSLETVLYGAAPVSPARLAEALDALGNVFIQLYGQVEAPSVAAILRKDDHKHSHLLSSCGRPTAGAQVEVHDRHEDVCPPGHVGEICIRGDLVMDGYWDRPDLTSEVLRNGWLHTGDMARSDDKGFLYIVDRAKDMIITGGINVFAREVEDVLSQHPAVAIAAVIGVPDAKWGEAVKGIVVLKHGARVGAEELISLVRQKKGPVHAPKTIEIVESLPLTSLAKVDKKALRAQYWNGQARGIS